MNTADIGSTDGQDSRAQSAILGLVLLIGIVAVASVGILLHAGVLTEDTQQETESERIEQAFIELSQTLGTTAATGDTTELVDFAAGEHGAIVKSNAGTIEIRGGNESSGYYVNETFEVGAIEYVAEDGTRIAYQAGGVFRETGNESQVISAPPVHYDFATETFTFPITQPIGDEAVLDSGEILVRHHQTHPYRNTVYVQDDSVDINITSPYYRSWATYFERQAGATSVRNVEPINDTWGTVEIRIGYMELDDAFETGVAFGYDLSDQHNNVQDYERASFPELDDVVYAVIDDARSDNDRDLGVVNDTVDLTDGIYYADEIRESGHLKFNLSSGNATLAVDGDLRLDETAIEVTDLDEDMRNYVNVYVAGDYDASQDGDVCVTANDTDCDENTTATAIRIIGTSEMQVDFGPGGEPRFEGVLYAGSSHIPGYWEQRGANCDYQVCILSNPDVYGAIIASSVHVHASAVDFEYAEELENADIDLYGEYPLPPQLTYLNLAMHEVEIEQR